MRLKNQFPIKALAAIIAPAMLFGCDGSSGGSGPQTGTLSLSITDGPVDSASAVVVEFSGVSIKPADGEVMIFQYDEAKSIDLLSLQGSLSEPLLEEEISAGNYEWIRLHTNAAHDEIMDSYIEFNDGTMMEMWVPSGNQTGLKLVKGFTVGAGGTVDMTIDFDLRKSVTNPDGLNGVILKPALRIVDNLEVGTVSGTVVFDVVNEACEDLEASAGAVYLYEGLDVTPSDLQGLASDPLASSLVSLSEDSYTFEIGFVPAGDYTVAYTCDALLDDPEMADELTFQESANISVSEGDTTSHNFSLLAVSQEGVTVTTEE